MVTFCCDGKVAFDTAMDSITYAIESNECNYPVKPIDAMLLDV